MIHDEHRSKNVIKGGYFNVSTKPADPKVDSISNWGTISMQEQTPHHHQESHNEKLAPTNR